MKTAYDIIRRPVITEQSMADTELKKYVFEVAKDATKIEIAKAVEEVFGVKVVKVNTLRVTGQAQAHRTVSRRPPPQLEEGQWSPCLTIPSPSSSSREWHKEVNALWLLRATSPQRLPAAT